MIQDEPQGLDVVANQLVAGYGKKRVIEGISIEAEAGSVTTLMGPNGCGKSTLLKVLCRVLTPDSGTVTIGGHNVHSLGARAAARKVALLPQHPSCPPGLTVGELVARGRHPHRKAWHRQNQKDMDALERALTVTRTGELADRYVSELSGGQRQRVWMAMVVAQETPVILLDEPTTFLDPKHVFEVLQLARHLAEEGKAVIMVLHDLISAGSVSDKLVVMKNGRKVVEGPPAETLTEEVLAEVYKLRAEVWKDDGHGAPIVVPRGVISG
ncbi:ABC transporter ATP-binding protein [Corynebacterium sp. TAE3-ERU12]|uniref:ABC transporter ATP-binding protein n=1 Tax=Corynebacterium sp. TAE3-ERU12 TaxID=2849491 RepID=UPI001C45D526|nr:ABC transporter ATP-binding protein [Corynebacterium sp. TAE3-ERU12]MBV7294623.1 ABC transporter ATP-binding protein [Corynebacterium sp. TAE3-ERU12]